ncbi:type I pantothenate kinase [Halalkalibacter akibai]|uniref:Pantothenate kinase n=1 Tax=Halalkalibacter akibai (strain ATCC 43226 / DSM 21942 / CIP 109018 / JCM 9157 / 1139) TaxID=1236973 RepID=W4QTH3_HALA3|nr:type I pantothenate kinase [Halalkalibacter akibai]GAE35440.1 pantothenate kinase [Halalkalibacter akibai JCM 9157]
MATINKSVPLSAYTPFTRAEWAQLSKSTTTILSATERAQIGSIDETISADEVADIYLPLSQLLYMHMTQSVQLHKNVNQFLQKKTKKVPFVIGIAGSVSVGKSTTARLIQALCSRWPNSPKVDLITTDGFLYPNATLEERGLMKRKGFPESYDIERLIKFLYELKSGCAYIEVPLYSHLSYDILDDEVQKIIEPDVVIVEGINVLQVNKRNKRIPQVFVSDFFDFSIYVDAEEENIKNWYIERFKLLRNTAFQQPESFFHRYRQLSDSEADHFAKDIWSTINGVNLEKNIRPTRHRADLILKKGAGHRVEEVHLKKT